MKLIHPDHERPYHLPGVATPARRPVDIDAAATGFQQLRSLRVYRFAAAEPVEGHAEQDEVFLVLTAGTATLQMGRSAAEPASAGTFTLSAFHRADGNPAVAYLPPDFVYRLTPHTITDVAYARAACSAPRQAAVFRVRQQPSSGGYTALLDIQDHAEHLHLRLARIDAAEAEVTVDLRRGANLQAEVLVHAQSENPADAANLRSSSGDAVPLHSWDTVALAPFEPAALHVPLRASLLTLTVSAE